MDGKKTRKEKREIKKYIIEQMAFLDVALEPYITKALEHIQQKFGLGKIDFTHRIQYKIKVHYNE